MPDQHQATPPAAPPAPQLELRHVDTHPHRPTVYAILTHPDGNDYVLGHLPNGGWFCNCTRGRRCPGLAQLQTLVPAIPRKPLDGSRTE